MVRTRGGGRCFPPGRREQSSAVRGTNSNSLSVENDNEMHEESPIGVNATLGSLASPTRNEAIGSGAQQNQISGSRNPNRRRPRTQLRQNNPTLERGNDAHAQENEIEEELAPTNNIYPPSVTSIVPPFRTRQRGLNRGTPHPAEPGLRILISISGQSFKPSSVVQEISASVKYHITGPWPSWAHFPDHLKTCLWELFEAKYRWTFETIDDIKRVWWGIANRRYRDIICKERKKVELKVKSSKPLDWRGHGPKWLGENTWNKLCEDHWSTEKFQRMSDAGKNNRRSSADGTMSTHTGGSRPFAVHEEEMEDEYKRKVSKVELYDRTHRTKQGKGEFICDKAKRVRDAYDNLVEDNSLSTFNPDAWIEACGGVPKGRVYGFGSQPPHQILGDIAHSVGSKSKRWEAFNNAQQESDERFENLKKEMEHMKEMNMKMINLIGEHLPVSDSVRQLLQDIQWTNHTHAGGSGVREQEFMSGLREGRRHGKSLVDSNRTNSENTRRNASMSDANEDDENESS